MRLIFLCDGTKGSVFVRAIIVCLCQIKSLGCYHMLYYCSLHTWQPRCFFILLAGQYPQLMLCSWWWRNISQPQHSLVVLLTGNGTEGTLLPQVCRYKREISSLSTLLYVRIIIINGLILNHDLVQFGKLAKHNSSIKMIYRHQQVRQIPK